MASTQSMGTNVRVALVGVLVLVLAFTCYNPLNLRYTDLSGVTHTEVFLTARSGQALRTSNGRIVEVDPNYPIGWKWAGEPVEWRNTKFTEKRGTCTGAKCECCAREGYVASFSC